MADAGQPDSAARVIGRFFFGTSSAAAFACAAALATLPADMRSGTRIALVSG